MCAERQRLRPWLEDKINSGKVPGLCWRDKDKKEFRVSWKHAGKPDFSYEKDAMLFKLWAEHTGKYKSGESPDPSTWKTRFRCALHKMPDVEEVRVPHSLDEKEPYRVFRFTDKESGTSKRNVKEAITPKAEKNAVGERFHPYSGSKTSKPIVTRSPLASDKVYNIKLHSGGMCYDTLQQDSPHQGSSDSSFDDSCDLDDITPTIPPYNPRETFMVDETVSGNAGNTFFPYSNSPQGIYSGDFSDIGFAKQFSHLDYSARKEGFEPIFAANAVMASGGMFGENAHAQAFLQHISGLMNMQLCWAGLLIPDETSSIPTSTSSHFNMDNGLLELAGNEMDDVERMDSIPYTDGPTLPSFLKTEKSSLNFRDPAFYIRVFYESREVLSTETRLTEGERAIRLFYGSPIARDMVKMDVNGKVYGPPGAKLIKLPDVDSSCREITKVMSYLTPGILLEITEDFDVLATRLAVLRVFYSNGWEAATKLERDKCTKVFDYNGKFLPTLKESRSGNCEYPSYDVTFYLGRGDRSLVSIVVTHVKAKMNMHNESTEVEKLLSEPSLTDQLSSGGGANPRAGYSAGDNEGRVRILYIHDLIWAIIFYRLILIRSHAGRLSDKRMLIAEFSRVTKIQLKGD